MHHRMSESEWTKVMGGGLNAKSCVINRFLNEEISGFELLSFMQKACEKAYRIGIKKGIEISKNPSQDE